MSRRRLATLAVVLGSLIGSTIAFGDFTFQPPLSFKPDDKQVRFGNTEASPDSWIEWDTSMTDDGLHIQSTQNNPVRVSGTSGNEWGWLALEGKGIGASYLQFTQIGAAQFGIVTDADIGQVVFAPTVNGGNQIVIGKQGTADYGHAAADDPTLFIHSDVDPGGDTTQWGSLAFDEAGDYFLFNTAGPQMVFDGTNAVQSYKFSTEDQRITFTTSTSANQSQFWLQVGGGGAVVMTVDGDADQFVIAPRAAAGRQVVITDYDNRDQDHGHNAFTDPVLYVHSAYDPETEGAGDTTQYVMLMHDQTDGWVGTGKGQIKLSAGSDAGVVVPTEAAATLNAPCAAANEGSIMYFDDTDDSGPGGFCGCVDADDGSTFAWAPMTAGFTCPS